jgi:hypothetical protein
LALLSGEVVEKTNAKDCFQDIISVSSKIGKYIDINHLDNRPVDSLFVEAIKTD